MPDTTVAEPQSQPVHIQGSSWSERARSAAAILHQSFGEASAQFTHLETARQRAAAIRWKTIENLDQYLIEFESNFIRGGGKVLWAQDSREALDLIGDILRKVQARKIIKSKTNTANEIGLHAYLGALGTPAIETDTGDYVLQAAGEEGSHMVMPALHKSLDELRIALADTLSTDGNAEGLVKAIRKKLRQDFLSADIGITGCNFLIADPGSVIILENEGNAQLTATLPSTHIVMAGVDKMLPSLQDIDLFLPLLSTYGTGQRLTTYTHIINGPRQSEETDGPGELYVILIDNGRSDVLGYEPQRQAMSCIRCGACQTACPVYNTAGQDVFTSPVAAVMLPLQSKDSASKHLSEASTLCGACSDVCPVKIDIPRLLIENRKLMVNQGSNPRGEKLFYFMWKKAMLKRELMSWTGINARRRILGSLFRSPKGLREMPSNKGKSFNEWYREKMNFR